MGGISEILEKWGAWASSDNSGLDWKPIAVGFKGGIPYLKDKRIKCDDAEGLVIDRCIARLKLKNPDGYELIVAHFFLRLSLRSIARKRKCSDGSVRKDLQLALGFIEGVLDTMQ